MALLILALLQRIFLMSSLMLLLVWLIFFMVLIKLLPILHFMRTLPTGSVDPNFGRRVRNRRQLNSLQNTWPYGYSMPIAVRYTQDAFSRSGWLWPVDAKGEPLKATSYMAVGFYVAKY